MERDEAREFFRRYLGDDWEEALARAWAVPPPGATHEYVDAAEQRAVELVSDVSQDWTLETREAAADAWRTVWLAQRGEAG